MRLHLSLPLLLLSGLLSTFTALAQVVAPSQGGEVGLTSLTPTTMELNFGVAGNGQGRVITVAPAPGWKSVRIAAVDNIFYSANTVFGRGAALGEGYVVYNGTGHSVVVTGLQPNTVYCIADAEYNTDGTTILYNIRSSSLRLSTPAAPQLAVATPTPSARNANVFYRNSGFPQLRYPTLDDSFGAECRLFCTGALHGWGNFYRRWASSRWWQWQSASSLHLGRPPALGLYHLLPLAAG